MYVYTEKDLENIRKEVLGKIADQRYELDVYKSLSVGHRKIESQESFSEDLQWHGKRGLEVAYFYP